MSTVAKSERNPALCIRCQPEWRRWVRLRSRQLGINESLLIELACSWFAEQYDFPEQSPPIWYSESTPRWVNHDNRYKDSALYINVTPEWKAWIAALARVHRRSVSWMIEEALRCYSEAQGAFQPPFRTQYFTRENR
jgi:hypothetical protein